MAIEVTDSTGPRTTRRTFASAFGSDSEIRDAIKIHYDLRNVPRLSRTQLELLRKQVTAGHFLESGVKSVNEVSAAMGIGPVPGPVELRVGEPKEKRKRRSLWAWLWGLFTPSDTGHADDR